MPADPPRYTGCYVVPSASPGQRTESRWRRGSRLLAPLERLSDEELATATGPEADAERAHRARQDACRHERTRRVGRSSVVRCVACGMTYY